MSIVLSLGKYILTLVDAEGNNLKVSFMVLSKSQVKLSRLSTTVYVSLSHTLKSIMIMP